MVRLNEMILKMEVSLKISCLPSGVEKQPSAIYVCMPDVSYLCLMSRPQMLNGDEDVASRDVRLSQKFCLIDLTKTRNWRYEKVSAEQKHILVWLFSG